MTRKHNNGFTIVELLIVIVVIAILAAISIVAYNGVQARARDSARISMVNDIAKALELYKIDNHQYPAILDGSNAETPCGSQTDNWGHCDRMKALTDAIAPYVTIDPTSLSYAAKGDSYYYTSSPSNNYQTYGLRVHLQGSGGNNDGGYFPAAYELGENPRYCMSQYTSTNANWSWSWDGVNTRRCFGGN